MSEEAPSLPWSGFRSNSSLSLAPRSRIFAGRYRVERFLGEGAAGVVWLTRDTRDKGRTWAVKELDYSGLSSGDRKEAIDLFEREASFLMQLDHKYLPKVVDCFCEGTSQFLVMERVEGPTLLSILQSRQSPLPEPEILNWGIQICEVLEYLHELDPPIIYRDLKPANVMVSVRGPIKLIDFGIARVLNPQKAGDTTAYGTPGYAPLEQYAGRATPLSDLYALGATLYHLATNQEPEQFRFSFPGARRFNLELSPKFETLLSHLLEKDASQRPLSASIVQAELSEIQAKPRSWWDKLKARVDHHWSELNAVAKRTPKS